MKSLRTRLMLSHVLPLLVMIPFIGLALVYLLESQVIIPNLAQELADEAWMVRALAVRSPAIWSNQSEAASFLQTLTAHLTERIMLVDTRGRLLASSNPEDQDRLGTDLNLSDLAVASAGQLSVQSMYNDRLRADVVAALMPVTAEDGSVLGLIRISRPIVSVYDRFLRQRYLITGVLALGLLIGAIVGWVLALDIARPLQVMTAAVEALASGQRVQAISEQGPGEISVLAHSFNSLLDRLTTLEEARRRLLANLVHELGRPLGSLHSAIQALQGGADEQPELRHELLAGMEGEVRRLRRLSDDLAQLRGELVGNMELNLHPVPLSEWLPAVLAPWRELARQKGLHWETSNLAQLPTVTIDPDRLAQALGNLLSNAIKYTPAGGSVSVSAGQEHGTVWMRVSDTGPGIALSEQAHIFAPFYRAQTGRRFPQGMGLGLSIARSLVAAHGGVLDLRSAPGQGSDFTLRIPIGRAL